MGPAGYPGSLSVHICAVLTTAFTIIDLKFSEKKPHIQCRPWKLLDWQDLHNCEETHAADLCPNHTDLPLVPWTALATNFCMQSSPWKLSETLGWITLNGPQVSSNCTPESDNFRNLPQRGPCSTVAHPTWIPCQWIWQSFLLSDCFLLPDENKSPCFLSHSEIVTLSYGHVFAHK